MYPQPQLKIMSNSIKNFRWQQELSQKHVLLVIFDWNAKVGPDAYPAWKSTTGKFGLGTTNDRRSMLLEFAKFSDLVLTNTLHPQKQSWKASWYSPDGKTHNMIDYILINKRFQSSVNLAQTRTFPVSYRQISAEKSKVMRIGYMN